MKSYRLRNSMVWLTLILMLIISLVASGCGSDYAKSPTEPVGGGSPLMRLVVENQTDQVLTIHFENLSSDSVEPGGQIILRNLSMNSGSYPIIAKNPQGETVFSETFTFKTEDKYHLQELEERVYKAVIPPLQIK
ncbi:hypothetical protein ACFLVB_03030 [Chloroflexota bacterium]